MNLFRRLLRGSPPRVRGTVAFIYLLWYNFRITPACAGNSLADEPRSENREDHPRVCGEQRLPSPSNPSLIGSPPRVRGTGGGIRPPEPSIRITPACAGNSPRGVPIAGDAGDHPRVCGEQLLIRCLFQQKPGSPPRVRGTAPLTCSYVYPSRITPACAGNSGGHLRLCRVYGDHPRVCGEQPPGCPNCG